MKKIKFEFQNADKQTLAGLLEMPPEAKSYAIFAHCFTCGKDIAAASRISRALTSSGIAVLRFDFTGLGNSDGDFANANFSSNISDLIAAADALGKAYQSPSMLIGHSLGGAAVLHAALQLESIKAVVTIGAPASADHVAHLFAEERERIESAGEARVKLGGRQFNIKQQFLDDIANFSGTEQYARLRAALLIFHSPFDRIVPIDEAARIYQAARHPKSFISLDQADHLVSKPADAEYVATTIAAWASRYLDLEPEQAASSEPDVEVGEVIVTELDKKFLRGLHTESHFVRADEPHKYGGSNLAPTPYDFLLMALGACTSMTLRMYANHKKLKLDEIRVRLRHDHVHAEDCAGDCAGEDRKLDRLSRFISLEGDLSDAERQRLLEIADRCPVHRTLENQPQIVTELEPDKS